ncbi:NAD(P)H-hydrate dehydratase [Sphingobacterium gobiense]|uniref:Bifunctional NAD(P)H-hydrate repair enzyme n=1 Tax=Sphingobacterium gobiense TaxID=1382456 RepID=A0A2S9JTD2_9SPHI|nr:NAD(P)H-hydrate dehydratase [Sphingobacterium gobiense]PRD56545.1 bifunctional ADP-dependent NAD(P)H-hydrate dehydratase/NAD(P)H-hydrate epimerase [Sphingobacterium gobiense]
MKILSAAQMYTWEQITMKSQNLAPAELMERAAEALFQAIQQYVGERQASFVILCGFGNNGGDGLAVGRMLYNAGHTVKIYLLAHTSYSAENQINQQRLHEIDIPILSITTESQLEFPEKSILIDALFGYGLSRQLDDNWKELIDQINTASNPVLSVDIPSGLFADNPTPLEAPIIQANMTYTFACPKLSLLFPKYAPFSGSFNVLDIGLDKDIQYSIPTTYHYTQKEEIQLFVKPLEKFTHKGTYGHSCIIGGSYGSIGAIILASKGSLKSGCGMITTYLPACGYAIVQSAFPEAQVQTDTAETHISMIPDQITKYQAIGIGMGMGTHPDTENALLQLFERLKLMSAPPALLLDADAINILAKNPDWHALIPSHSILTPHPKELERLIGSWVDDFEKIKKVREWSSHYKQIVVVKGANSAIILPDGNVHFNSTGNPGMATGGSGDVLSGIITALLAQHHAPTNAALLGVYLHGLAGDIAATSIHEKSITATDIINHLSAAWQHISSGYHSKRDLLR